MSTAEALSENYVRTYRVIHRQLDGVTHEESLLQPPFRGNCLNWVLGHIVVNRDVVLSALQEDSPWPEADAARYRRESDPITSPEQALALSQLLAYLEESQSRIVAGLARTPEERLQAKVGERTLAEQIAFANWHETYHVGQLELLRQLAGKNDKVI